MIIENKSKNVKKYRIDRENCFDSVVMRESLFRSVRFENFYLRLMIRKLFNET